MNQTGFDFVIPAKMKATSSSLNDRGYGVYKHERSERSL